MAIRGDTIFALASARGRAGVAVFRISGPSAFDAARSLCGTLPSPRRAGLRMLAADGHVIDEALVLVFEAGASFTGEPTVELHAHGSVAVARSLEAALSRLSGCRLATPGEFTRRALENGRLDLTQVEGLADLLAAETDVQLRQAQRALAGELGRQVEEWRSSLIRASALVEAVIDFAGEEVPVDVTPEVREVLEKLVWEWRREAAGSLGAERIRDGFEVAIVGAPNTGKSTLVNTLARREIALISDQPGTTRDVLEVRMDLGGLAVTFLDTAGIRDSVDMIEVAGIERAKARATAADLRLYLDDSAATFGLPVGRGDLLLHGKCDLSRGPGLNVSGKTGEGLDEMLALVRSELEQRVAGSGLATRDRHREALIAASAHVDAALERLGAEGEELVADDLRAARVELDTLVGRLDVEDILGHIFSSFCIGK